MVDTGRPAEGAAYYDEIFGADASYALPHGTAPWAHLWRWCVRRVEPDDRVLELGCGPGHLAAHLLEMGLGSLRYLGVDFSVVALEQARARVPAYRFIEAVLPDVAPIVGSHEPTLVIACEVLEHVDQDLGTLSHLEPGTRVLGTVPKLDGRGHVRVFHTEEAVRLRYGQILALEEVVRLDKHWAFEGRVVG